MSDYGTSSISVYTFPSVVRISLLVGYTPQGVTSLGDELFVSRSYGSPVISVYDVNNFTLRRNITLPSTVIRSYLAASEINNCVYMSDRDNHVVYKISMTSSGSVISTCSVCRYPSGMYVTSNNRPTLLVACSWFYSFFFYNSRIRFQQQRRTEIALRSAEGNDLDYVNVRSVVELSGGRFGVTMTDPLDRYTVSLRPMNR